MPMHFAPVHSMDKTTVDLLTGICCLGPFCKDPRERSSGHISKCFCLVCLLNATDTTTISEIVTSYDDDDGVGHLSGNLTAV